MAKFWIEYSDSVLIEAKTREEAEALFWDGNYKPLCHEGIEINYIEEAKGD